MSEKKELKDLDTNVSGTTYTPNHDGEADTTSAAPKGLLGSHTAAVTVHLVCLKISTALTCSHGFYYRNEHWTNRTPSLQALCLVMFSQVAMIVGSGAVCRYYSRFNHFDRPGLLTSPPVCPRHCRRRGRLGQDDLDIPGDCNHHERPGSPSLASSRLLGQEMVLGDIHHQWICRLSDNFPSYFNGHGHRR
jgi:hypothetical protein